MPCYLVRHFHVLLFHVRHFQRPRGFRGFMRKTFNPCHKLSVRFSGEAAIDDGGPTREFLRLALSQIESKLFYGESTGKFLTLDASGMNSCCHCSFTFVYRNNM